MLKIAHLLEHICLWSARMSGLLLFVLTGVVLYDIVGRQFFNTGSVALQELEWHIHGAIVMLGFGYAYTRDGHVRIDILSHGFSNRSKIVLEIVGIAFFLTPFLVAILWYGFDFAHRSFVRNEGSSGGLGLDHRWIIKSVVPLSAVIALLGAWSVLIRSVASLCGRNTELYRKEPLWNS